MITFEPTYLKSIAFAIVLRFRKSPISSKPLKAMVDACVYAWAFSLLGLQVFGDTSKPTGMPTLLLRALCQGDSIAKTTKYGRILLFHIIRVGCRRYRRRVARHPQLKASIPTSSKQKI